MKPTSRARAEIEIVADADDLYRLAMMRAAVGEALVAPDGTYVIVNPALCALLGMEEEQLLQTRWDDLTHPEDLAESEARTVEVLDGRSEGFRVRKRFVRPDGTVVWGDVAVSCVREPDGRVRNFVSQVSDLTELMEAQRALARSEEHYRLLAERTGDLILSAEADSTIRWVSPSCERVLGWGAQQMVGRPALDFVHPEDAAALRREALLLPESGESRSVARYRDVNGDYRWFERLTDVAEGEDGGPAIHVTRLRDVHDEVLAEQQLVLERQRAADGQARLRGMLDALFDPYAALRVVRDDSGSVVDFVYAEVNPAACRAVDRTRDELLGTSMLSLNPGILASGLWEHYVAAVESGEPVALDEAYYPSDVDARHRYFDIRVVPTREMLHLSWRDVTERHEAAVRLAASERRLHATIDTLLDPHLLLDATHDEAGGITDFRVLEANPEACRFFGRDREHLIGHLLREVDGDEVTMPLLDRLAEVVHTGGPVVIDDWEHGRRHRRYDVRAARVNGGVSLSWRDVTARFEERSRLLDSEARLKATIDTLMDPHVVLESARDEAGDIVDFVIADVNVAACEFSGLPRERLVGVRLLDQLVAFGSLDLLDEYARVVETGVPLVRDDWHLPDEAQSGGERWYDIRVAKLGDGISQTWRDVTEQHRAARQIAESEEHFRMLAENATDVVVRIRNGVLTWVSPSIAPALGGGSAHWEGTFMVDHVHPSDQVAWEEVAKESETATAVVRRLRVRAVGGEYHWVEVHARGYVDASGRVDGMIASFRVVDAEVAAEAQLQHLARHDSLTGLLNRSEALDRLVAITRSERRAGVGAAVLFCDIDDFKGLNDQWGHLAGDQVLRVVSQRITERLRDSDVAARLGGDELLVILDGVQGLDDARAVAGKLLHAVEHPVPVDVGSVGVTMSIGVTLAGEGEPIDQIIARADAAMYQAKAAGRHGVVAIPEA